MNPHPPETSINIISPSALAPSNDLDTRLLLVQSSAPTAKQTNAHLTLTLKVSTALRLVCCLVIFGSVLSFILSVANKQETAWPLMNISQYAANYPAIYFFRIATSISAVLLLGVARSLYQNLDYFDSFDLGGDELLEESNPKVHVGYWTIFGFFVAGIGLGGAGLISCHENNNIHTSLALAMFFSQASIQTGQFRSWSMSIGPCIRALGTMYLWVSLVVTALMSTHTVTKVAYVISLLEWTATLEICAWCWWWSGALDVRRRR